MLRRVKIMLHVVREKSGTREKLLVTYYKVYMID